MFIFKDLISSLTFNLDEDSQSKETDRGEKENGRHSIICKPITAILTQNNVKLVCQKQTFLSSL